MSPSNRFTVSPSNRRRRGQVLIITLICITLLVGLIFYVYNLGTEVDRRLSLQHAADSAAISGTDWMCRAMNTVAMNNCESSRLLAMVPILDSLPVATSMAQAEIAPWDQCLSAQLAASIPETPMNYSLLISGLQALEVRFNGEAQILSTMNSALNGGGFNMQQTTWWQPPGGGGGGQSQGALWQAAAALDSYSRATVNSAGSFAQSDAIAFGQSDRAKTCFIVPVAPQLPVVRSTFQSFQPTIEGVEQVGSGGTGNLASWNNGPGGAIPDMASPYRLGPWARLWHWRFYNSTATAWQWQAGQPGQNGPVRGLGGLGGRSSGSRAIQGGGMGGGWQATQSEVTGYTTFGPYNWAIRQINWYFNGNNGNNGANNGPLRDTDFATLMSQLSRTKLTYMFDSQATQYIHEPNWIIDYNQAMQVASSNPGSIYQTMAYLVEVASTVPEGDPKWMTPGTFTTNGQNPVAIWFRGWRWPQQWDQPAVPTLTQIADYVWKGSYTIQVLWNAKLGITLKKDSSGNPIWQNVYIVDWFIWGGIDVGTNVAVQNPCQGAMDLPAPWVLDTSGGDYTTDPDQANSLRRKAFTFLAVARNGNRAPFWPGEFGNALPDDITAVAQSKMFNNKSFDAWTQDWQAQLTPVSQWTDWMNQLETGVSAAGNTQGLVNSADVQSALTYLRKAQQLADGYMNH